MKKCQKFTYYNHFGFKTLIDLVLTENVFFILLFIKENHYNDKRFRQLCNINLINMIDPNRPYSRLAIDKIFAKTKAAMQQAALIRGGDGLALYTDVYTGKTLRGGDAYDYEHLRSSEAVHTQYKSRLTDVQIALVVNCPENVGVTLTCINKSKGKRKMEDWLANPANITANRIDLKITLANLKKADEGIEKVVRSFLK